MTTKRIVILYEELAGYFIACISKLIKLYDVEVHIIRADINHSAPFKFPDNPNIYLYRKDEYNYNKLFSLIKKIKPDMILCGGWKDGNYLKVAKKYYGSIPTLLGFDNKWENTFKQNIAVKIAPYYITNRFSHCFIPGTNQREYAKKLGFKDKQIMMNAYSANFDLFHSYYKENWTAKKKQFPKRFIYIARYIKHKGINDIWQAFLELKQEYQNDWELWCFGIGDIPPIQHPQIKHFGFVQQEEMKEYLLQTGVFVLPSHFEPWGVVVHEFASAGFPLICSDKVGATEMFLQHGKNGFIFPAGNITLLKEYLLKVMRLSDEELNKMGERSVELAKQNTPHDWATTIYKLIQ